MRRALSLDELIDALVERNLIRRKAPLAEPADDRPWYISVILGAAGWLAGLFALAFVGALFTPETPGGFAFAGLVMLGAGFGLYAAGRSAFFDQLALALSIAGQLALAWAAADSTESAAATAALVTLMQVVLLAAMPNRMAKVLAAFFACIAWALAIRFALWGETLLSDVSREVPLGLALVSWLVIWAPLIAGAEALIAFEARWMAGAGQRLARTALTGLLMALAIATWASEPLGSLVFWSPPRETYVNWLVLWPLLGAATSLFAAVCAYRLQSRALVGFAIAGGLLHVMQFYYLLGTTLVVKSMIMLAVGVALLLAAWGFGRRPARSPGSPQ
ncbi:MAG TPA: DUF4401 domain-containing protein [Gammaproteobacteria bacterium]|jgi:hypothetical protein